MGIGKRASAWAFAVVVVMALAPATALATDKEDPTWTRIYGKNELDTMEAIASDGWDHSDVAVIARNDDYHDALSATSLAGLEDAPILLTDRWHLSSQTAEAIKSLGVTRVYIAGGSIAISKDVESSLEDLGVTCTRVYGSDPAGTARAVMERGSGSWGDTVIVARGNGFEDALSVSPSSYSQGYPIVLCEGHYGNVLSQETLDDIRSQGFTKAVIVGGTGAVSADVEGQLASTGVTSVSRLGGQNQYDTSALIGEWEVSDLGMSRDGLGVATARKYQDALTGGAYCGHQGSILVLADDGDRSAAQTCYRTPLEADEHCVTHGEAFGGWMAVSEDTYKWLHRVWADDHGHYEHDVVVQPATTKTLYRLSFSGYGEAYDETGPRDAYYVAKDGHVESTLEGIQSYCHSHQLYGTDEFPATDMTYEYRPALGEGETLHHDRPAVWSYVVWQTIDVPAVTQTTYCSSSDEGARFVVDRPAHWTWNVVEVVVTDKEAYDETVVTKAAWDEDVTKRVWVVDTAAYDEKVVVTEAYNTYGASDGTQFTSKSECLSYCHANDCTWGVIPHPAVTKTVHHDEVGHYEDQVTTIHHAAETKVVHHDAVTHEEWVAA